MDTFLTIKQAVEFSGKSKSTIRRLIDEVVKEKTADARSQILPSAEDVERLRRKGEPYTWKISEEFLRERFEVREPEEGSEASAPRVKDESINGQIVEILRDDIATLKGQLDRKDEQLREANERLKEANDRNREQNILLGEFQKRLPQPREGDRDSVVDARVGESEPSKERDEQPKKEPWRVFGMRVW